jgi:hypothetical protein
MAAFRDVDRLFEFVHCGYLRVEAAVRSTTRRLPAEKVADWLEDINGRCTSEAAVDWVHA